jgi:hypothetical protein
MSSEATTETRRPRRVGDTVFVYVNPRNLVEPTEAPVFEAKVIGVHRTIKEQENDLEEQVRYRLEFATWDEFTANETEVFTERGQAVSHAKADLSKFIVSLEKTIADRKAAMAALDLMGTYAMSSERTETSQCADLTAHG